ncbi:MAG TPA: hypothetical protein VKQ05_05835 [Gemmatimonadales bacterium]|nr:hypothetical protein [Gemmatimonadales bacterium]
MPSRILVVGLTIALAACAHRSSSSTAAAPPDQTRFGPAVDFGPGIVDVSSTDVDLRLDAPAYVIAFRVTDDRGIQLVAPLSGSPRSKAGVQYFRGSDRAEISNSAQLPMAVSSHPCTRRPDSRESCAGLAAPRYAITQLKQGAPPEATGYWLLIVSDKPTAPHDIMRQLEMMRLPDTTLVDLVRGIPEPLIASRTGRWAAYYAAFTISRDQ